MATFSTISAFVIIVNVLNKSWDFPDKPCPVTATVLANLRNSNGDFKKFFSWMGNQWLLHVSNDLDIIPNYLLLAYDDIGEELEIDTQSLSIWKVQET